MPRQSPCLGSQFNDINGWSQHSVKGGMTETQAAGQGHTGQELLPHLRVRAGEHQGKFLGDRGSEMKDFIFYLCFLFF